MKTFGPFNLQDGHQFLHTMNMQEIQVKLAFSNHFFVANIGSEHDQQTWMKNINEPIHNQNHNKRKKQKNL